jgi:hypothetical protein
MAKKKEPTVEDALKVFKDVTLRASLSSYYYVDLVMLSKNEDGNTILVIPDRDLILKLREDPDMDIKELDISNAEQYKLHHYFKYGNDLEEDWFPIEIKEELFSGKIFKIRLHDREYEIPINRELMPLKLKKAEYDNVSYKIFTDPLILAIKKRFDFTMEGYGFTIMRLFQVI